MSQIFDQSRCFVVRGKALPDAGSEVLRRAGFAGGRSIRLFGVPQNRRLGGYTLIEVLVVAVVVVLMLGMALPVFRAITGSRSEAGASNNIASMLGRVRTDAIGLQHDFGVAFLYNPSTQVQYMAEVQFADCPGWSMTNTYAVGNYVSYSTPQQYYLCIAPTTAGIVPTNTSYWQSVGGPPLELSPNTELIALPAGIAVQTLCNCQFSGSIRTTDGYLSVGVILFDANGQLKADLYGIAGSGRLGTAVGLSTSYPSAPVGNLDSTGSSIAQYGMESQFGLVVFQKDAFVSQAFSPNDPAYFASAVSSYAQQKVKYTDTASGQSQQAEENWLDQNATPLLINRYTGTLIRGE